MTVNPKPFLQRIKASFPDLTWKQYVLLNHGWDHIVVILDNAFVFRFPSSPEYLNQFKDEVSLLTLLSTKIQTPIPQYIFIANDFSFGGYPIIPGKELQEEIFARLSSDQQGKIAQQLGSFLSKLHTFSAKEVQAYSIGSENYLNDFGRLKNQLPKYLKNVLSREEYALAQTILHETEQLIRHELPRVLIHADLSSAHILWDASTKKIGIIDFSDRLMGDPALDFAELYAYGEAFVDEVYAQYHGPKDPQFRKRAKLYYKRVGVFLMIESFISEKITFVQASALCLCSFYLHHGMLP